MDISFKEIVYINYNACYILNDTVFFNRQFSFKNFLYNWFFFMQIYHSLEQAF